MTLACAYSYSSTFRRTVAIRRQTIAVPHSNARRAVLSIFALVAAARDISLSLSNNAGSGAGAAIVRAYARPRSFRRSVPRKFRQSRIGSADGKGRPLETRESGCGGGVAEDGIASPPSRVAAASLFATKSSGGGDVEGRDNARYHLVWSPNFWKKMLASTALWLVVRYVSTNDGRPGLGSACHATTHVGFPRVLSSSFVLPLLSSSCCAIQLIVNALTGWGCAGFNSYLGAIDLVLFDSLSIADGTVDTLFSRWSGPIRPAILPLLLMSTWKLLPYQAWGWTVLSISLAFLPELVDIWNANRSRRWRRTHVDDKCDTGEEITALSPSSITVEAILTLNIPTMGCVACVNKVDASIRGCNSAASIREETSWLTGGTAKGGAAELRILGRTNEEIKRVVDEVVAAVKDAGFRCDVESLRVDKR
ncbi:hypothetical protein ACHAW5_006756 [Stephanodiscus triporus]|uniref:HMA domain-containing protein n=1 Tax=Stephanodiscus triporus TaxID=2934178 RepID=A0ABD3NRV4_9STRA